MDNSKLNQSELSYESSAGIANVNLVTGRLLYEHFDASVGLNTKNLSVSHVYNSHFESTGKISSNAGKHWKLDIQQYLYYNGEEESDTYTYIDAVGMEHTFEHLSGSEYYDTSGMGLILSVGNGETKITDLTGNEMYFEQGKLVKIKTNEGYEKIIKYNETLIGKKININLVYDTRDSGTKIDFEYDGNNLLKKINVSNVGLKYSMKYFYNNFELTHITKEVIIDEELDEYGEYKNKVEKIETMFKYNDNNLLIYAVSFLDKNGFNFDYDNNKVTKVITGTGNIVEKISEEAEPLLYVGDDIYVGENNYVGETFNRTIYLLEEGMNCLNFNNIVYNDNCVDVTNELGVTLTYFFDTDGKTVSVLEKDGNNYNLLTETIGKNVNLKHENKSSLCPVKINETTIYNYNTSDSILFNNDDSSSAESTSKEKFYITKGEYSFSFWLYLTTPLISNYLTFSLAEQDSQANLNIFGYTERKIIINPNAVGCWQQVTAILDLSMPYFNTVNIKFPNDNNVVYLTDLHFYQNNNTNIQLKNDVEIQNISQILINNDLSVEDFKYLTEKDMYLTCYHKSKIYLNKLIEIEDDFDIEEKENEFENLYFPLYYNNGTKAVLVTTAKFKYADDKFYVIGNDINNDFDYKIVSISADNKTKVEKNISLLPNCTYKKIYDKCFCITSTTTIKDDENEENNIVYNTYEYYDLLNRLILTIDPYDVHYYTKYTGNTITTTIEKNGLSIETTESFIGDTKTYKEGTKIVSEVKYDKVTGLPLTVTEYEKLKQEYFYNKYNNMLEAIKVYNVEKDEEDNIIKDNTSINRFLNSEGKVVKLTDGNHVYNYKYDELGRLIRITTLDNTGLSDEKELYTEEYIKNTNGYEYTLTNNGYEFNRKYDKYGNLISQSNNGYEIEYLSINENGNLNEGINKKITKVAINKNDIEQEKVILNYSGNNLCTSSTHIKKYDIIEDEEHLYNVVKIENKHDDDNTIECIIGRKTNYDDESQNNIIKKFTVEKSVIKDYEQQRISGTRSSFFYQDNDNLTSSINTIYEYDDLGRISDKKVSIQCSSYNKTIKKHRDYNNILPIKDKYIKLTGDNENEENLFEYNYEYDENNHNLKRITRNDLSTGNNCCFSRYEYDDYDKLKEEEIALDGTVKKYTYNDDNNISNVLVKDTLGNVEDEYKFHYDENNKDLLIGYETNNKYTSIQYDYYGKIKKFIQDGVERILTWNQGKFLTKITNPDSEIKYEYDYLGRRISKEYDTGEKVEYFYNGNLLVSENIYMKKYVINLSYMYEQNEVIGFSLYKSFSDVEYSTTPDVELFDNLSYNTFNTYYYVKDVLGNITAITDGSEIIVTYNYDAWGNHKFYATPNFTAIALLNPFRYRGYFYDVETGYFWLSSRYYSPELCRFISPDDVSYLDPTSINGLNLYAYCMNNPVMCRLGYNLGGVISAPISNIGSISSNISSRNRSSSPRSMSRASASSTPFANVVSMTNYSTTLVDNILIGMALGNISHTITTQHNDSGVFYRYSNIGNSTSSKGVGLNIKDWYGLNAYVSSNIGIGSSVQLGSITYGAEISVLDGISFSFGTVTGNVTNETTISIGWGTLAFAYAACGAIAATPVPMARAVAAAVVCVVVLIDIFN